MRGYDEKNVDMKKGSSGMYIPLILMVLALLLVSFSGCTDMQGEVLSKEEAGNKTVSYINDNNLAGGAKVSLVSVNDTGSGVYEVMISVGGREFKSYATKDGKFLFVSGFEMDVTPTPTPTSTPDLSPPTATRTPTPTPTVTKSDKPEAHAFVMSYCPYGLQFIKAYVPVIELLGDKADIELNFVHYAMHDKKELDENTRMYCIQKEQKDKLTEYLRCFVEHDDPDKCITDAEVDNAQLESCINSTDNEYKITEMYNDKSTWSGGRFPQYPVDATLANQYGVGGSPTFILNGNTVRVTRSANAIKEAICSAFNSPPTECDQTLSTTAESAGIGAIGAGGGSGSGGKC